MFWIPTKHFTWVSHGTKPTSGPANVRPMKLCDYEFLFFCRKFCDFVSQNVIFGQNRSQVSLATQDVFIDFWVTFDKLKIWICLCVWALSKQLKVQVKGLSRIGRRENLDKKKREKTKRGISCLKEKHFFLPSLSFGSEKVLLMQLNTFIVAHCGGDQMFPLWCVLNMKCFLGKENEQLGLLFQHFWSYL